VKFRKACKRPWAFGTSWMVVCPLTWTGGRSWGMLNFRIPTRPRLGPNDTAIAPTTLAWRVHARRLSRLLREAVATGLPWAGFIMGMRNPPGRAVSSGFEGGRGFLRKPPSNTQVACRFPDFRLSEKIGRRPRGVGNPGEPRGTCLSGRWPGGRKPFGQAAALESVVRPQVVIRGCVQLL